jgi:hypothetical protein
MRWRGSSRRVQVQRRVREIGMLLCDQRYHAFGAEEECARGYHCSAGVYSTRERQGTKGESRRGTV